MAEGRTSDGFSKSRSVLGDLTNRLGKRGFSGREKSGIKSFSLKDRAKQICVSPRTCTEINSWKGNIVSSMSKILNGNRDPDVPDVEYGSVVSKSSVEIETDCDDDYCLMENNALMGNSKVHCKNKDIKILDLGGRTAVSQSVDELDVDSNLVYGSDEIGYFEDDALPRIDKIAGQSYKGPNLTDLDEDGRFVDSVAAEAGGCGKLDLLKETELLGIAERVSVNKLGGSFSAVTSRTVSETDGDCLHDGKVFDADESKVSLEGTQSDINDYQNDGDDHNADNLVLSGSGSIDCMILPESQESRALGVERSTELKKRDECAYMSREIDSTKACSCSFCTKAGYIWLDLNYQDIEARVSAMKESQKEASILAGRGIRSMVTEKHGAESFTTVSKLESELMYQWGYLFQHVADIWMKESNQLEARLQPLTNLREKCKADLELINSTLSEKH